MQRILITGSNRGVGLALVHEYLRHGNVQIWATCRNPDTALELQQLANTHLVNIVPLDLNNEESIVAAAEHVQRQTNALDLLINNAGIFPKEPQSRQFGQLQADAVADVVVTNAVSPLMVTQAFVELLRKGDNPRVAMVSSRMGSLTHAGSSGISYRMSKAAMNMAAKALSVELRAAGITVITTHPGHVATDMGGSGAPVSPESSARGLAEVIDKLTIAQTGKFYDYTGGEIDW